MREKTITVEIDERGNSSLDLTGFEGKGCGAIAHSFQGSDKLLLDRSKREFHVEHHQQERSTNLPSGR